jgi:RsiW-degrading membrane proteinase PrsW (M82 family)
MDAVGRGGAGRRSRDVALGLTRLLTARLSRGDTAAGESSAALRLCIVGLLGVFAVGYPGYFVFDAVWPSFYYSPVPAGKNAWLLAQAFFIAVYFAGALMMFNAGRRALNAIPAMASEGAQP